MQAAIVFRVELDVFSGQPNPGWTLDQVASAQLARRLDALSPSAAGPLPEGLGYRGLRVAPGGALRAGELIEVGGGLVQITAGDGSVRRFADPARGLERWLIDTARGHVDPALHAMVAAEAQRGP